MQSISFTRKENTVFRHVSGNRRQCASIKPSNESILFECLHQAIAHSFVNRWKRLHFHLHCIQRLTNIHQRNSTLNAKNILLSWTNRMSFSSGCEFRNNKINYLMNLQWNRSGPPWNDASSRTLAPQLIQRAHSLLFPSFCCDFFGSQLISPKETKSVIETYSVGNCDVEIIEKLSLKNTQKMQSKVN